MLFLYFLRAGFDENVGKLNKTIDRMINSLLNGNISEDEFCNIIGQTLSSKIKTFARNLNSPANSRVTKENSKSGTIWLYYADYSNPDRLCYCVSHHINCT